MMFTFSIKTSLDTSSLGCYLRAKVTQLDLATKTKTSKQKRHARTLQAHWGMVDDDPFDERRHHCETTKIPIPRKLARRAAMV